MVDEDQYNHGSDGEPAIQWRSRQHAAAGYDHKGREGGRRVISSKRKWWSGIREMRSRSWGWREEARGGPKEGLDCVGKYRIEEKTRRHTHTRTQDRCDDDEKKVGREGGREGGR